MPRDPKLKDIISGFSATEYLTFISTERDRKATKERRKIARLMKERGFTVFMVGETQRERKKGESA